MMRVFSSFILFVLSFAITPLAMAQNYWEALATSPPGAITGIAVNWNGDLLASNENYLYRSVDNGASWTQLESVDGPVLGIAPNGHIFARGGKAIVRSTDNGANWTSLRITKDNPTDPPVNSFAITPLGEIIVATGSSGLYISKDDGGSWGEEGVFPDPFTYPVFIGSMRNGDLYASTNTELAHSTGIGQTWTIITGAFGTAQTFASGPNNVAIVAGSNGVFRSTDHGANWTLIATPDGSSDPLYKVAVAANGNLFYGLSSDFSAAKGLFRSTNDGAGWDDFTAGLSNTRIHDIAISRAGFVYVATDNGIFKSLTSTGDVKRTGERAARFDLRQVWPNPVREQATISFSLPEAALITLKVFDVSGREVKRLAEGRYSAGSYSATFDTKGLPKAPYYYALTAGDRSAVKMLMVSP